MSNYGTKPIAGLTDAVLLIAEEDVANCLLRAHVAPDETKYNAYFESLQAQADAIQAEKTKRGIQ